MLVNINMTGNPDLKDTFYAREYMTDNPDLKDIFYASEYKMQQITLT